MFFRILRKDLKRNKIINGILFLFMCIATMFVSSGINNVLTVMNGTEYYLNLAGVGDYTLITMSTDDTTTMRKVLDEEASVKAYRIEEVLFGSRSNIKNEKNETLKSKNAAIFQSIEKTAIKFFDSDNNRVSEVTQGHVYVTGNFLKNNDLKAGDKIRLTLGDVSIDLILDGKVKDALLGSDMMGNTRFLMNEQDMECFLKDKSITSDYHGQCVYVDTDDISAFAACVKDIPNVGFDGTKSTVKMTYVMDMIIAFVILILSVCLIIVSLVVLKFFITFTIEKEFREIGVMKGIGLTSRRIQRLYLIKYLALAFVAAMIGFCLSIPFGNMLLKSVSENMVLGSSGGVMPNLIGAILVVLVILGFAKGYTRKIKRITPIDAIRSGQTGERYHKKSPYRLSKGHAKSSMYLAVNDVLSHPRRFVTIFISFILCTSFVLMLVATIATMKSDKLISSFATKSDLYMTDVDTSMKCMRGTKDEALCYLHEIEDKLLSYGMPSRLSVEVQYKYPISVGEKEYHVTCLHGMEVDMSGYKVTEGSLPQNENEIAITPQISELTGVHIGDIITIDFASGKRDCMVTAYFETMNQLGSAIRLHEDAPVDFANISSMMSYQIDFTDNPDKDEIIRRREQIKEIYDIDEVMTAEEYVEDCIRVVDTVEAVKYLLLGITIMVVILMTIMMEQSFISSEKSQIALLKAIGFSKSTIKKWHVYRFGVVTLCAVLLAAGLSVPMTELFISPVFGMMGQRHIDYEIQPLKIFVFYPLLILLVNQAVTRLMTVGINRIKSGDTAGIE